MVSRALLLLLSLCVAVCISTAGYGQANDVSVSAGGIFSPNSVSNPINTAGFPPCPTFGCSNPPACVDCLAPNAATSGVAFEGTFAHRLLNLDLVSLHLELPVMVAPNRSGGGVGNFSQLFFTPGLRLKFSLPLVSPFLSLGGGFGHFSPKNGFNNSSVTRGALGAGAGVDLGTHIPLLGFRAEVREFYTGDPYAATQHSVFAGGGLVFKF